MEVTVPGDKSISHRALLLAALAEGESRLTGLLTGADVMATAEVLRALGVEVPDLPSGATTGREIRVRGIGLRGLGARAGTSTEGEKRGALSSEALPPVLDCGNSGTTARLLMGILAGSPVDASLDGDASLRSRPMRRVTLPLSKMGAHFEELGEVDRLPIRVRGGRLRPIEYDLPMASAQVKSAMLLAGITGGAFVLLTEPGRSRDHTERMLRMAGASVLSFPAPLSEPDNGAGGAWRVELREPPSRLHPLDLSVPGDFSSAAFLIALALMGGAGEELVIRNVGVNPTRTGLLPVLLRMGGILKIENSRGDGEETGAAVGEPRADLVVRPSELRGVEVLPEEIPGLIDEIPVLAALASRARGTTRITGAAELRVKESDRLGALAGNLRALGVGVEELPDGLEIEGGEHPLEGSVRSFHDHRIAMAFGVLGTLSGNRVEVKGREVVDVSFPGFWEMLDALSKGSAGVR